MMISIEKLSIQNAASLFQFEVYNRAFFEKSVPSRGDAYYQYDHFLRGLQALLDEQAQGISFFGLIKNSQGDILGRMNLVDIEKDEGIGHLGYRVGEDTAGKGVASQALKIFLAEHVPQLAVKTICAKTTTDNISSQKVLLKNGFEPYDMGLETPDDFLHFHLGVQRVR
ncbi:GNAT family N-acetyltransferase [Brevibacillus sp. HB1.4B]|uniref:GNAT family N-acetyltransferase n=1 Tax=Brevibacillus sp. HB1.4B TaxID=2738845 RepID=UPI00156AA002|nr:GNAT family N-acetyltransferase [Brevibacillus sp. HB1.4B]